MFFFIIIGYLPFGIIHVWQRRRLFNLILKLIFKPFMCSHGTRLCLTPTLVKAIMENHKTIASMCIYKCTYLYMWTNISEIIYKHKSYTYVYIHAINKCDNIVTLIKYHSLKEKNARQILKYSTKSPSLHLNTHTAEKSLHAVGLYTRYLCAIQACSYQYSL